MLLTVDDALVEMRHRHRGSADLGLTVDLRVMTPDHRRDRTPIERGADGQDRIAPDLGDSGLLEQVEGEPAGTDEHRRRPDRKPLTGSPAGHHPVVTAALETGDFVPGEHLAAGLGRPCRDDGEEGAGERSEVDVRAALHPGRGDRADGPSALHRQWRPLSDPLRILGELHVGEERIGPQRAHPPTQIVDIVLAEDEIHVRRAMDERRRIDESRLGEMRPPLTAELELPGDRGRLRPVCGIGHVVEFAEPGMAGAGVVPRVAALGGELTGFLEHDDAPRGFEDGEHRPQGRGHDAGADEHDIGLGDGCGAR